jgi:hypothetical protein
VWLVCVGVTPALAHPWDSGVVKPTTYGGAMRKIRDEIAGLETSRRAGDLADVGQRAQRLAFFAEPLPQFALTLPAALRDSAVGVVLRATLELRASAGTLAAAAERGDSVQVASEAAHVDAICAVLETHAPQQYVCSMHCEPGKTYDHPGRCPVCGMSLQRITSDRYRVKITPEVEPIRAGAPVTLDFQIDDPAGFPAASLQVVHEKLLHLILVSEDLSWFSHEHPEPSGNGAFRLRTRFPVGGAYVLFNDFTPDSSGMQVVPVELTVAGGARRARELKVDDGKPKRIDGCDVTLSHTPLLPSVACALTFTLSQHGQPVSDLEPFLGVQGHLILINRERTVFVHSHPLENQPSAVAGAVQFNVVFERPGVYKAWGQFQRQGRVLTVPFVVEVAAAAPASVGVGTASR